jgi:hypothetical protein
MPEHRSSEQLPYWITFYSEGDVARNAEVIKKFTHAVNCVLDALPADDLRPIASRYGQGARLGVQLRDSHPSLKEGPSKDACAQCIISPLGDELIFKAGTVGPLADDLLKYLIAHEFGHLFLRRPSRGAYEDEEKEVEQLMVERWKFATDAESKLNASLFLIAAGHPK